MQSPHLTRLSAAPFITDPKSHVAHQTFDALNRLSTHEDPYSHTTTTTYDAHDRVLSVKDVNGHTTTYTRDGFGYVIQTASPDSGTTVTILDLAGNMTKKTDASSYVTNRTFDALNRELTRTFPGDTTENVTKTYDQTGSDYGFGVGRLTSVTDNDGSENKMLPVGYNEAQKQLVSTIRRLFRLQGTPLAQSHIWDVLHNYGRESEALLYACLFIPTFIEIDGSILYTRNDDLLAQNFSLAKSKDEYSIQELEDSFNRLDTSYIFNPTHMTDVTDEDDFLFAQCVAEAWRARLCLLYPTRRFQVSVLSPTESGDANAICFHETR